MKKSELILENESLKIKIEQLQNKNKLLNELATFYADPLVSWDNGDKARKILKAMTRSYRPVKGNLAVMFREKEVYPFIEFGSYIDERLESEDEEA